jgi:hypothetical protein
VCTNFVVHIFFPLYIFRFVFVQEEEQFYRQSKLGVVVCFQAQGSSEVVDVFFLIKRVTEPGVHRFIAEKVTHLSGMELIWKLCSYRSVVIMIQHLDFCSCWLC